AHHCCLLFSLRSRPRVCSPFPYTTLFRSREDALRWREAAVGGERPAMAPERKTVIADAAGVAHADLGSQAVRVGRTVYVASQLADRKSTRLNSSHEWISYAVFCLKKKRT